MAWHIEDPPGDFEKNRNEVVYGYQGNRNPFIDHPDFVGKIWGDPTKIMESSANRFIIYPNPFTSGLHIRNIQQQAADYYLYHSKGTLSGQGSITDQEMFIDLKKLSAGLYLLMIIDPSGHQPEYHRIVKY
ncbi:MAG: endonuclease [bacterium]